MCEPTGSTLLGIVKTTTPVLGLTMFAVVVNVLPPSNFRVTVPLGGKLPAIWAITGATVAVNVTAWP